MKGLVSCMKENLKKLAKYYKPYLGTFIIDMILAMMSAAVALVIPLVVRYITSKVAYMPADEASKAIFTIVVILFVLVLVQWGCNYYISNYGHVMGAKIEYDMRAEIFNHYQKLSYSFYDDQKVGQLLSRITSDLFDITELLHHGPENITISLIKIVGALVILSTIDVRLTLTAFVFHRKRPGNNWNKSHRASLFPDWWHCPTRGYRYHRGYVRHRHSRHSGNATNLPTG